MESLWERLCKVGEELMNENLPREEVEFLLQRAEYLIGELTILYREEEAC
jgi:hypothetical protein